MRLLSTRVHDLEAGSPAPASWAMHDTGGTVPSGDALGSGSGRTRGAVTPASTGPMRASTASCRPGTRRVRDEPDLAAHRAGEHPGLLQAAQRAGQIGRAEQHDVRRRLVTRQPGRPAGGQSAAFSWSREALDVVQRDRPAAASTPRWRTPPPSILRSRRASSTNSADPATTEPTAPRDPCSGRPARVHPDGQRGRGSSSATEACHSRAPSRCTFSLARRAAAASAACSSASVTTPPGPCGVLPGTAAWCAACSTARAGRRPQHCGRRDLAGRGVVRSGRGMPPAIQAAVPSWHPARAPRRREEASPRRRCAVRAMRLPIEPLGTTARPASRASRQQFLQLTHVGSPSSTSSPTSAVAIAHASVDSVG